MMAASLLVLTYDGKSILCEKRKEIYVGAWGEPDEDEVEWENKDYDDIVSEAASEFMLSNTRDIRLATTDLKVCRGRTVIITPNTWPHVLQETSDIIVLLDDRPTPFSTFNSKPQHSHYPISDSSNPFVFHVHNRGGQRLTISTLTPECPILILMMWIHTLQGIPVDQQTLILHGKEISDSNGDSLADAGVKRNSIIELELKLLGSKPVIYLEAPVELDVSVNLSLIKQWKFSAIYPVVPVKSDAHCETINWEVRTKKDGSLNEKRTGLGVSYLYWEAETNTTLGDSSPAPLVMSAAADQVEPFLPLSASVESKNSVLLSLKDLPSYLNRTLLALGLHTEARTSFITYWLPSFNKFPLIALRFVPQASYEQAAPLDISPAPDVVTRVFMLFRGIKELDVSEWKESIELARAEPSFWCQVIGVDLALQKQDVFKVLEWGGMEVFF
ncbi:hypothetical protein C8J56DRAFT_941774 [Mycena floridula]|nr:hypothetical protein C8J56DRAFT_941774 [Mycena floridula]